MNVSDEFHLDTLADWKRTHDCGSLRASDIDREALLMGWVNSRRDLGNLIFIDLRDREGITQIVFDPNLEEAAHAKAHALRSEWVLAVKGKVSPRLAGQENQKLPTGAVELKVTELKILNRSETPPFQVDGAVDASETLRLKYRYLELRRRKVFQNFLQRHRMTALVREVLNRRGFIEADLIEAIVVLPGKLFYGNNVPGCLLLLNKAKPEARKGKILMIWASRHFQKGNPQNLLRPSDLMRILVPWRAFGLRHGNSRGYASLEGARVRVPLVTDLDRKGAAGNGDDGRGPPGVPEERGDGAGVESRGGDDEEEVLSERRADLPEHREGEVGVAAPLVKLVQHHAGDAGKRGILQETTGQDPFGHDEDPGPGRSGRLVPDLVARTLTRRLAQLRGDPPRGGPGGDPARLQDPEGAAAEEAGVQERARDSRRLARAGRRDEDDRSALPEPVGDAGKKRVDRKRYGHEDDEDTGRRAGPPRNETALHRGPGDRRFRWWSTPPSTPTRRSRRRRIPPSTSSSRKSPRTMAPRASSG